MPIPPLVAEIDNPPMTKAGINLLIPRFIVSGMENFMIQNINTYISHIKIVWAIKSTLFLMNFTEIIPSQIP